MSSFVSPHILRDRVGGKGNVVSRDPKLSTESFSPTRFALLLHSVPHVGEKTLTRLLHHVALHRITPDAFLTLTPLEWQTQCELDSRAIVHLCEHRDALVTRSEELARVVRQHGVHVLTAQSLTYPDRLERFDDVPPPVLYALGNLALLKQTAIPTAQTIPADVTAPTSFPKGYNVSLTLAKGATTGLQDAYENAARAPFTFSIAVSNGSPLAMLARQDAIASELVRRGCVPVTGHDRAAYKRLGLCAQRQNRPAIYVLDRGLREALGPDFDRPPFSAARIRETVFAAERDLAVSPFRLDDHALGANNRRRDRVLYALADLIIALDARAGGGMVGECLRAHRQGRMVWVAEGGRDGNEELRQAGCPPMPAEWHTKAEA